MSAREVRGMDGAAAVMCPVITFSVIFGRTGNVNFKTEGESVMADGKEEREEREKRIEREKQESREDRIDRDEVDPREAERVDS